MPTDKELAARDAQRGLGEEIIASCDTLVYATVNDVGGAFLNCGLEFTTLSSLLASLAIRRSVGNLHA